MLVEDKKQSHHYTLEEYLALEEKSEVRHEFYNGEVYAMAGGTVNHNRLTRRIANLLESQASLKTCGVFSENMKIDVRAGGHMPYPDVVVTFPRNNRAPPPLTTYALSRCGSNLLPI